MRGTVGPTTNLNHILGRDLKITKYHEVVDSAVREAIVRTIRWRAHTLWFSSPTDLNRILGTELKIKMYHEVANGAIMDAVVRPFGGKHTHRSRV